MGFKALENQRNSTPAPPLIHQVKEFEEQVAELYENSEEERYIPGGIRATHEDPFKLFEQASYQARVVDTETGREHPLPFGITYDKSTINAMNAAKEAASNHEEAQVKLTAYQNNQNVQPTDLETALRKIEGTIQVTAKKVVNYSKLDGTMSEMEIGFIDSDPRPGTEFAATIEQLNTGPHEYKQEAFAIFDQKNQEAAEQIQQILEKGTGATFQNRLL